MFQESCQTFLASSTFPKVVQICRLIGSVVSVPGEGKNKTVQVMLMQGHSSAFSRPFAGTLGNGV